MSLIDTIIRRAQKFGVREGHAAIVNRANDEGFRTGVFDHFYYKPRMLMQEPDMRVKPSMSSRPEVDEWHDTPVYLKHQNAGPIFYRDQGGDQTGELLQRIIKTLQDDVGRRAQSVARQEPMQRAGELLTRTLFPENINSFGVDPREIARVERGILGLLGYSGEMQPHSGLMEILQPQYFKKIEKFFR